MNPSHIFLIGRYEVPVFEDPGLEDMGMMRTGPHGFEIVVRDLQDTHTYVHECIHALADARGIGLDENQTRALEHALIDAVRDNPHFALCLLGRLPESD